MWINKSVSQLKARSACQVTWLMVEVEKKTEGAKCTAILDCTYPKQSQA